MVARIEVTQQLKKGYHRAKKSEKTGIINNFCQSTGLSRSTARRYLILICAKVIDTKKEIL